VIKQKDWEDFLVEADLNHDGLISKEEMFQYLKRKQLESSDLQGITIGIPLPAIEAGRILNRHGLQVSINGLQYELKLVPVGETKALIDTKLNRLGVLTAEIEAMEELKQPMDKGAAAHAGRVMKSIFAYLFFQVGVVIKLTFFSRFGWDVMEPITYLLTFSTSLFGLAYFTWNKLEFSYPALAALLAKRKAEKLYAKNGFDYKKYQSLQRERADLKRALDVMIPPKTLL